MKRNLTLDSIKGLLIVLVVLGHSLQYGFGLLCEREETFYDDILFRMIYSFHMPLFMLISGYLFYYSNQKPFVPIMLSKFKYIGIPFIVYSSIIYIYWWYMYDVSGFYFSDYIRKMSINMWFLSALLMNSLIVGGITHFVERKYCVLVMIIVYLFTLLIPDEIVSSMHKYLLLFFILGYYCKRIKVEKSIFVRGRVWFICLSVCMIGCLIIYSKDLMIYNGGFCILDNGALSVGQLWKDIIRFIINGIGVCWFLNLYSLFIAKIPKIIKISALIGKRTLPLYGLQSISFMMMSYAFARYDIEIPHNYITPIIVCVFIMGSSWIIILIIDRYRIGKLLFLGK